MLDLSLAYIIFSIGYFTISLIQAIYKYQKFENSKIITHEQINGIILKTIKQETEMPLIITPKYSTVVPITGAINEKEYFLFSKFNNQLINYECLDKTYNKTIIDTTNSYNILADRYNLKSYNINIKLPLAAYEYKLMKAYSICKSNQIGLIGTNKQKLIINFVFKTRLPFTFTIGLSALALLVINYIIKN